MILEELPVSITMCMNMQLSIGIVIATGSSPLESVDLFWYAGALTSWMTLMTFILDDEESFLVLFLSSFRSFFDILDLDTLLEEASSMNSFNCSI